MEMNHLSWDDRLNFAKAISTVRGLVVFGGRYILVDLQSRLFFLKLFHLHFPLYLSWKEPNQKVLYLQFEWSQLNANVWLKAKAAPLWARVIGKTSGKPCKTKAVQQKVDTGHFLFLLCSRGQRLLEGAQIPTVKAACCLTGASG